MSLALFSGVSSQAAVHTVPGALCASGGSDNYPAFTCGVPSGTDFDLSHASAMYVDVYVGGWGTSAQAQFDFCRESYSSATLTCGPVATSTIGTSAKDISVSVTGVGAGASPWDYYMVQVWGIGSGMTIKGVGAYLP